MTVVEEVVIGLVHQYPGLLNPAMVADLAFHHRRRDVLGAVKRLVENLNLTYDVYGKLVPSGERQTS